MSIVKWSPFKSILSSDEDNINRVFDLFFKDDYEESLGSTYFPAVDITETKENYILNAELPGLTEKEIKLNLKDNILYLSGEKKEEKKEEDKNYRRVERRYGSFSRAFRLNNKVNHDKVKATFKNGVLKVVLEKAEEDKGKDISIDIK